MNPRYGRGGYDALPNGRCSSSTDRTGISPLSPPFSDCISPLQLLLRSLLMIYLRYSTFFLTVERVVWIGTSVE